MFYDNYVILCASKGVSCTRAAVEAGISHSSPAKWKATSAVPNGETLNKLAVYFGVSVDQLLSNDLGSSGAPIDLAINRPSLRRLLAAVSLLDDSQINSLTRTVETLVAR